MIGDTSSSFEEARVLLLDRVQVRAVRRQKSLAVDPTVDHPGSVDPVVPQGGDEGGRLPVAERGRLGKPLAGRPQPLNGAMFVFTQVPSRMSRRSGMTWSGLRNQRSNRCLTFGRSRSSAARNNFLDSGLRDSVTTTGTTS